MNEVWSSAPMVVDEEGISIKIPKNRYENRPVPTTAGYNPNTRLFKVRWGDGSITETAVHPEDEMNPNIGFALCLAKKMYGGSRGFHDLVRKTFKGRPEKPVLSEEKNQ